MASRSTLRRLHTFTAERRCAGRNVNGTQWVINPRGIAKHYAFGLWFPLDFFSVLNRGSQYRVESMLSRLGRTQGATMPSPDKERVRQQPALEALPCILEPESRFYTSPVAVLDFRSLYPSVRVLA